MDLDDDIAAALRALKLTARTATPVTGFPSAVSDRVTMRIDLADGHIIKARRHSDPAKAKAYANLVRSLGHLPLPAILLLRGRVTIEEWITGRSLTDVELTRTRIHRAADILGAIHATDRIGRRRIIACAPTRPLVIDTRSRVEELVVTGALSRADASALRASIRRVAPRTAMMGLTHNDLCAENIVEDSSGRLYVVDNAGMRLGFLDFDVARSWYRWPMAAAAWRQFGARYQTSSHTSRVTEVTRFWQIAAVVRSAAFRVARRSAAADIPLRRLRRLIRA